MSTTEFIDGRTPIVSAWLNDVDSHVYNQDSDPHPQYTIDTTLAASSGASLVGYLPLGTGATGSTVQTKLRESVSVKDFGAVGDGVADDTAEIQAAIDSAKLTNKRLHIPAGTYLYSALIGLDQSSFEIFGDGSGRTVLKYTGTGDALVLGTTAGFSQGINLSGLTVEGNADVDSIIKAKALARCQWSDINVREAKSASGIGFVFQGCMLNRFESLVCSTDRQAMTNPPYEAFNIEALAPFGNCSNNTFTNLYAEGNGRVASTIEIGVRISGGDQNVFIGGSPESCGTYGLLVAAGSRYNTFIGVGFENLNATGADCSDAGISSKYVNCYSSQKFILQGRSATVDGGYFERVQIDSGAVRSRIKNALVNGWATGSGGLFDSGTGTETLDIYDSDSSAFISDIKPRFLTNLATTATNQTGNGAVATISFGTEIYDDNNNVSGSTFTAPVAGRYQLNTVVSLDALSTSATLVTLKIVTPSRTYMTQKGLNPKAGGLQDSITMSIVSPLGVGDTAYVTIQVDGMAGNTVSIVGSAVNPWTTFSGSKV